MKRKDELYYDQNIVEALEKLPSSIFDKKHNLTILVRNDQARSNQTRFQHIARKDHQLKVRDIESIPEGINKYVRYVKSKTIKDTFYYYIDRKGDDKGFIEVAILVDIMNKNIAYIKTIFITYRIEEK